MSTVSQYPGRAHVCWIAFDAVGTLLKPDPPAAVVYSRVARRHGSRLTEREIRQRFSQAFSMTERSDLDSFPEVTNSEGLRTSEDRERRRWREIVTTVIDDVADAERCFDDLFSHFARPDSWRCFREVAETLAALNRRAYRLAVASNFDNRLHQILDGLPELKPIELRVISSEVGYRKPSPHFYRALVEAADCAANEMLMVGDDTVNDIIGARRAGLSAVGIARGSPKSNPNDLGSLFDLVHLLQG